MFRTRLTAVTSALLALPAVALAQATPDIQLGARDCSRGIHLVARQAQTTAVVQRLSSTLGFRLRIDEPIDSLVTIDTVQPPAQLLSRLLDAQNVIYTETRDPRCPGKQRIAAVWVLKKGIAPGGAVPKRGEPWPVTPEAREQEELYQRAHGMLPELPQRPAAPAPAPPQPSED